MSNGHTNCNYSKVYNLNNMSGFQSTNGQNMGAYYNNMPNINSTSSIFNYRNPHMFPALGADPGCHFRHNESDLKNLIQSPFHMNLMNYPYLYWPYNSVYNMNLSMELNANMQTMNNSANLLNSMVLDVQPPGSVNLNYSAYNKPIIIDL